MVSLVGSLSTLSIFIWTISRYVSFLITIITSQCPLRRSSSSLSWLLRAIIIHMSWFATIEAFYFSYLTWLSTLWGDMSRFTTSSAYSLFSTFSRHMSLSTTVKAFYHSSLPISRDLIVVRKQKDTLRSSEDAKGVKQYLSYHNDWN